ncbi:MAG: hypothetical protein IPI23_01030 [Bacteroidetes bacterium]|nr:hypothetical protein [Bacteroidota bacterium]
MTRNLMFDVNTYNYYINHFRTDQDFDKDIEYGYGINSATGLDTRQALTYNYSPTEIAKSSTGQTISFHAIEIKTRNELIQSLATSLSIGGKGSYGAFSASASYKRETFNKLTINDYSQYLLINVTVRNPDKYIQDPILSDVAKSIARDFPNIFLSNFGDEFVFKKIYGGELYILFEFQSHSQVEYDRTKTAITAAASYFTAQGNISYTSEYIKQQLSLLTNKKIWLIREGGLKSIPQTEIDQLLKYARVDFIADIATNPLVLGVETKSFKNQFFVETDNVDFKKIRDIQRSMLDAAFEQKNLIYQNIASIIMY